MLALPCHVEVPRQTGREDQARASRDRGHVEIFRPRLQPQLEVSRWPFSAGPVPEVDGEGVVRKPGQTDGLGLVPTADEEVCGFEDLLVCDLIEIEGFRVAGEDAFEVVADGEQIDRIASDDCHSCISHVRHLVLEDLVQNQGRDRPQAPVGQEVVVGQRCPVAQWAQQRVDVFLGADEVVVGFDVRSQVAGERVLQQNAVDVRVLVLDFDEVSDPVWSQERYQHL